MLLKSVLAEVHVWQGGDSDRPSALLLTFEEERLRLRVAGDGQGMLLDREPLEPVDMGEAGLTKVVDVTRLLDPRLEAANVATLRSLKLAGTRVGIQLVLSDGEPFHFWAESDELWWGDTAALVAHTWLDARAPTPAKAISFSDLH